MSFEQLMEHLARRGAQRPDRLTWRERLVWTAVAAVLVGCPVVVCASGVWWGQP